MATIIYKEIDDLTQKEAAALYGFSSTLTSKWFNRLERRSAELFEDVVYAEPRSGRPSKLSELEYRRIRGVHPRIRRISRFRDRTCDGETS